MFDVTDQAITVSSRTRCYTVELRVSVLYKITYSSRRFITEQRQKRWQVSFLSNILDLSWNILMLQRRKRTILVLQGISISFPTWRIGAVLYSGIGREESQLARLVITF